MKKVVVLTGAGISAESGLKTFRDSNGLWENHKIEDVATPQAWKANPEIVLEFYNQRRLQASKAQPNEAHVSLVVLEKYFNVTIVTQNVDDLHERAGSSNVIHLHGELKKARSSKNASLVYQINKKRIEIGDLCEEGNQLRPHIVWFGEEVPMIQKVIPYFQFAEIVIVVGTSLSVYPASGLVDYVSSNADCYYIDPNAKENMNNINFKIIPQNAEKGVKNLVADLKNKKINL
tara:strand:+ start:1229 stop:1927 length:699 start_codon:yes stop_codon:yes gene_type:complete